jgi:tetratricopeptide (TPR) repeat protein
MADSAPGDPTDPGSGDTAELLVAGQRHHQNGDLASAEDCYRRVLQAEPRNADAYHLLGLIGLQAGQADLAAELIDTAAALSPDEPVYHCNLATARYLCGHREGAESAYRAALERRPDYPDAHANLGTLLLEQGRYEQAHHHLERAVVLRPDNPGPFAKLAEAAIRLDRHEEADEFARAAGNLQPVDPDSCAALSRALRLLGRPRQAIRWGDCAREQQPAEPQHYRHLALDYLVAGLVDRAEDQARRALELAPEDPESHGTLANVLLAGGDWDTALEATDRALALAPDREDVQATKAALLERLGRREEAFALVRPLVEGRASFLVRALNTYVTLARRLGRQAEAVGYLEKGITSRGLPQGSRVEMLFQAGSLYDDLDQRDKAFAAVAEANRLKPRQYDAGAEQRRFERIRAVYSADFLREAAGSGDDTRRPVFIVGMPRSGTSLTEQILASHPQVHGAGELTELGRLVEDLPRRLDSEAGYPDCMADWTAEAAAGMAAEYRDYLDSLAPPEAARVTDKLPTNFLHLGLISLLYPEAAIIHCRRDPMDTCLSCFFQNFGAAGLAFAYDLESLGHFYRLYQGLMDHWRAVLPNPMLELDYEALVDEPEAQTQRLLAFCDLPWDDACLRFHEARRRTTTASYDQVRRPIYTSSVARWRRYEPYLAPLKRALADD